jgi:hypothetical protein
VSAPNPASIAIKDGLLPPTREEEIMGETGIMEMITTVVSTSASVASREKIRLDEIDGEEEDGVWGAEVKDGERVEESSEAEAVAVAVGGAGAGEESPISLAIWWKKVQLKCSPARCRWPRSYSPPLLTTPPSTLMTTFLGTSVIYRSCSAARWKT